MLVDIKPRIYKPPFGSVQVDWGHPLARGVVLVWVHQAGPSPNIGLRPGASTQTGTVTPHPLGLTFAQSPVSYLAAPTNFSLTTAYTWMFRVSFVNAQVAANHGALVGAVTSDSWGFAWDNTNAGFQQAAYHQDAAGVYTAAKITSTVNTGVFNTIGGTYDGTNLKVWFNGINQATTASNTAKANAGNFQAPGSNAVACTISFIYVWNRALSPVEMLWLWAEPYAFLRPVPAMRYWSPPPATVTPTSGTHVLYLGRAA